MANSYLNRTLGTPTNSKKFTFSAWVKKSSNKSGGHYLLDTVGQSAGSENPIAFDGDQKFRVGEYTGSNVYNYRSNARFRDTNAWYHCVVQGDSTQSTASDRVKLYVNNELLTSDTNEYPSQNYDFKFNVSGNVIYVGRGISNSGRNMDGYMPHVAFVDGSVVAPTVFGETDSTSGMWKFRPPSGITWGNNGYHLKFENSGNLGLDSSGEGNNFTVNGDLKQSISTPSNIYNTLNILDSGYANATELNTANGGTTTMNTSGFGDYGVRTNLAVSKGKWYWECKNAAINGGGGNTMGLLKTSKRLVINLMSGSPVAGVYGIQRYSDSSINIHTNGSIAAQNTAMFGGITTSDIIGFALDMDNGKLYLSKNGSFKDSSGNTGNPATQAYPTFTGLSTGEFYSFYTEMRMNNDNGLQVNFGEGRFGTTAISSAGSNGNGALFEYDVPSGFYALNTKNINTYG